MENKLKLVELEQQISRQHDEFIRMENSIRSLEAKLAQDKENFVNQLNISADQITVLRTMITAQEKEDSRNEIETHMRNNIDTQCSIF